MLDYQAIAARIREERKFSKNVSQEVMAAELGMYQADVSNLERARKGSGISDLNRLNLLARYFGIPLEELIFGRKDKDAMLKYEKNPARLKAISRKAPLTEAEAATLSRIFKTDPSELSVCGYEYGPYRLIIADEVLTLHPLAITPELPFEQRHAYLFLEGKVIGTMRFCRLNVFMAMNQTFAAAVQDLIPHKVFDFCDVVRRVNPWVAFMRFAKDDKARKEAEEHFWERMRALQPINRLPLGIVESIYVREDCRRNGLCRLMIDAADVYLGGDASLWLNMQPADDEDMEQELKSFPEQTQLTAGQMSLNAHIAEKLGFTIETDSWNLDVLVTDAEGNERVEKQAIRKIAYRLSAPLAEVLKDDGDLVDQGRAMQKIAFATGDKPDVRDPDAKFDPHAMDPKIQIVELPMRDEMEIRCPFCGKVHFSSAMDRRGEEPAVCEHMLFWGIEHEMIYVREDFPYKFGLDKDPPTDWGMSDTSLFDVIREIRYPDSICFFLIEGRFAGPCALVAYQQPEEAVFDDEED